MLDTLPIQNILNTSDDKKTNKKCNHDFIRKEGIISCSKCSLRSIMYLLPLKK